jgi:adenylyltransferase/sulfurtransferase
MKIHIPTPLRQYTRHKETVEVSSSSVQGALDALVIDSPELRKHLFTEEGKLRSFVNVYLNEDDIRYLPQREDTATTEIDELTIIPSIAGGAVGSL